MAMNLTTTTGKLVLMMMRSRQRRRRTTRKVKAASCCRGWHHHPPHPGVRGGQGGRVARRDHGISQTPRSGRTPWITRNVLNTLAWLVSWPDTASKGSSNEKGCSGWINFGQLLLVGREWGVVNVWSLKLMLTPEEGDENMWRWEAKQNKGYQSCHPSVENSWTCGATFRSFSKQATSTINFSKK